MELPGVAHRSAQGANGKAVLLLEQDRSLWDYVQIQRGMAALHYARKLGGGAGDYALQAAIIACHSRASTAADTDSTLTGYHLLRSLRGDLLMKLGRFTEAREEIQRAIAMTENRR